MKYIDIKKNMSKIINKISKAVDMKILKDAGLIEKYCDETLWFESISFNEHEVEFSTSCFKVKIYIIKFLKSTRIITLTSRLELNSNSYPEFKHEYIENKINDILIAERIINSIIENEDYIVKQVEYAFNTSVDELFKKYLEVSNDKSTTNL